MGNNILQTTHVIDIAISIAVCLGMLWLGPYVIKWLMRHVFVTRYMRTLHKKDLKKRQRTLSDLFTNIWRILVVIGVAYYIFTLFFSAKALAPLFASAGIIGVAFGFGAQTLVKDFLTGVFIISENQFRVGDIIQIDDAGGTVERIGVRSTVLRDADGNVHYFPNSMVQHVINKTMGYSMARFTLQVDPEVDIDKVAKIINKLGLQLAAEDGWKNKIIEAPQFASIGEFTSTAVNIIVSGKTQPSDQWSTTAEMRRRILEAFDTENITLAPTTPYGPLFKK